jgi:hypothetical protein
MLGWIVCSGVLLVIVAFQSRLLWKAIENTSAALISAHHWREKAEARAFPGEVPDIIMLDPEGVPHRENDCGSCIKYVREGSSERPK